MAEKPHDPDQAHAGVRTGGDGGDRRDREGAEGVQVAFGRPNLVS